jgi:hypothetical protein
VDVQRQLPRGVAAAVIVLCTIKKACPTGSNARITVQTIEIAVEIVPIHFTDRTTITHIIRIILGRKIKVGTEEILAAGSEAVGETTSVVVSVIGGIGNVTIEQLPRGVAAAKGEAPIVPCMIKKASLTDNEVHITGLIIEIIAASMDEAIPTAIT